MKDCQMSTVEKHQLALIITPGFVIGVGGFGLLVSVYLLLTSTATQMILPEGILELLLLGIPAIGLLYTGYWFQTGDFTPEQLWQIGTYAVGATLIAAMSTVLAIALFGTPNLTMQAIFFLLVSTGTEGALLGALLGVFALSETLRRRGNHLQRETDWFHFLERTANIGYWEFQPTTDSPHQVFHSKGLGDLHQISPDEPFDVKTGLEEYHPEDRPRVEAAVKRAISEAESFDIEARLNSPGETHRWIRTVGEPVIERGQVVKVRGVMQDITNRKESELQLKQQNDQLEQFASVISHDLRNPLNVAQGRLSLAQEECESKHLTNVEDALERMQELIEDLLALAREGDRVSDTETVDLAQITVDCWQYVETADATLQTPIDRSIQADPSRLTQLLENLFRNAVEHGGDNVTVTIGELDGGFYVEDDGPGIPEDERDEVFEAGYSAGDQGSGFGLAIVKQIVDAHGWTIRVTESDHGGARFEIRGVSRSDR